MTVGFANPAKIAHHSNEDVATLAVVAEVPEASVGYARAGDRGTELVATGVGANESWRQRNGRVADRNGDWSSVASRKTP